MCLKADDFPITTKVVTFKGKENAIFSGKEKYLVPQYQRDYSWGEKQIGNFIDNILDGYNNNKKLFMGTIQFSKKATESLEQDIVDGQQRLTTVILLLKLISLYTGNKDLLKENSIFIEIKKSAEQQKQFTSVLDLESIDKIEKPGKSKKELKDFNAETNVYSKNIRLMRSLIESNFNNKKVETKFMKDLQDYIFGGIYFVELTTIGLGIPDTVKIFNIINTTGLDLNSSDIFKLQYYQYMKDNYGEKENHLDAINSCYEKIEKLKAYCSDPEKSKYFDSNVSMSWVLDIYKHILAAKYSLTWEYVSKSNEAFFEWILKKENSQKKDLLKLEYFQNVVDTFIKIYKYTFIEGRNDLNNCAQNIIETTRYSRYWTLPYVISFFMADKGIAEKDVIDSALYLSLVISKYFIVNSVLYDKVINPVQTFMCNEILPEISEIKNGDAITSLINGRIWLSPYDKKSSIKDDFKKRIEKNLYENRKRCHIICTISAILDEGEKSDIREKFFNWKNFSYDNEHILSQSSFPSLTNSESEYVNGIGNLVTLEAHINRQIKDDKKKKIEGYEESKFSAVKKIKEKCPDLEWTVQDIIQRKDTEIEKFENWLSDN